MLGDAPYELEHQYQSQMGGPPAFPMTLESLVVQGTDGEIWEIEGTSELAKLGVLVVRRAALHALHKTALTGLRNSSQEVAVREKTTYLNIIGGLLGLMLGKTPSGKRQSVYESQAAIIEALMSHEAGKPGISKTTLEAKFAEAKRTLIGT